MLYRCQSNYEKKKLISTFKLLSNGRRTVRWNRLYSSKPRPVVHIASQSLPISSSDLLRKNNIFFSNILLNQNRNRAVSFKSATVSEVIDSNNTTNSSTIIDLSTNSTSTSTSTPTSAPTSAPTSTPIFTPTSTTDTSNISSNPESTKSDQNPSIPIIPFEVRHLDHSSPRKSKSVTETPFYAPYLALTKPRLSALVILSAMSAYALTPYDATLSQLLFLTIGTALSSGSANAINMAREYEYDAQMTRTRTRPVVRGLLTPNQAFGFAGLSGTLGVTALYFGVNPTVAALGAANIVLYGWIYTSLKRKSIINTWAGAVVGAIPPLMGWAASSSLSDPGAWALAGLLYAWQFPHFNSLSHNIREEYRRAGYVMAAWTNPSLNARVALKYSVAMFPLCIALSYFNVTDWFYAIDSGILNGWLTYLAFKFWTEQRHIVGPVIEAASSSSAGGSSSYARKLFWGSVLHLPGVLVLAMIHKKGQWDWLWPEEEDEDDEDDE